MRDARIDTARGLLILGVVAGHLLERSDGWDSGLLRAALTALYAFHMPAFVFLTGYVAKTDHLGRRLAELAAILVVFQIAFIGFTYLAGHGEGAWYWPYWVLWYVMALFWWQLTLPLVRRFPRAAVVTSVALALLAGYAPFHGNWFAYERTLVLAPFFVVGALWGPAVMRWCRRGAAALLPVAFFAVAAGALFALHPQSHWLFHNWTYAQLDVGALRGPAYRLALLVIGAAGTLAVLTLTPRRSRVLERLGRRTLPVFLFHAFFLLAYGWWIAPHLGGAPALLVLVLCVALGPVIALVCATDPFVRLAGAVRSLPRRVAPSLVA